MFKRFKSWLKSLFRYKTKNKLLQENIDFLITKNFFLEEKVDNLIREVAILREEPKEFKKKVDSPPIIANGKNVDLVHNISLRLPSLKQIRDAENPPQ